MDEPRMAIKAFQYFRTEHYYVNRIQLYMLLNALYYDIYNMPKLAFNDFLYIEDV